MPVEAVVAAAPAVRPVLSPPPDAPMPDLPAPDDAASPPRPSEAAFERPAPVTDPEPVSPTVTPPRPPDPTRPPTAHARSGGGGVWLALALLVLLAGGALWLARDRGMLSSPRLEALEAQVAQLAPRLEAAEAEAASLRAALAEAPDAAALAALGQRIDEVQAALQAAASDRDALRAELEDLARRPPEVADNRLSEEAVAAYQRELAAMRQMVEAELARVRAASEEAAAQAVEAAEAGASADSLAVLAEVGAALAAGAPFSEPLDRLAALDEALPVGPLLPHAMTGVPPMTDLQASFPQAARLALDADANARAGGGLSGFLRAQLGMRSLSPQEGDGADAVLSRAEAALRAGNLSGALTELSALSGPAAEALAEWRTRAEARAAAEAAYADLENAVRG
jgi:hypothetical protein